jgi:arginine/lysine/ornithine decarboxylase
MRPDIDAIYLTSPSFDGLLCDYKGIRGVCGDRIFILDEAHGSHLYFKQPFGMGALQTNCVDVAINSTHKNLGGQSATALINIGKNSRVNPELIKDLYLMKNSTSPNVYLLFDMEGSVRAMKEKGDASLRRQHDLNAHIHRTLKGQENIVFL